MTLKVLYLGNIQMLAIASREILFLESWIPLLAKRRVSFPGTRRNAILRDICTPQAREQKRRKKRKNTGSK
jgi:hypothetical protein